MPELLALEGRAHGQHIDIVKGIGMACTRVGTLLLDDKDGTIVPAISHQHGNNAELINMDILGRWIRGEGLRDCTWRVLLGVLRKAHCVELAESVEEALTDEEAEQGKSISYLLFRALNSIAAIDLVADNIHFTHIVNTNTHTVNKQKRNHHTTPT